jgi:branched-chain amino acid transport system ATP-binding protein
MTTHDSKVGTGAGAGSEEDLLLSLDSVSVRFGGLVAVSDVGFELRRGERLALLGPNGAGKTTLFNVIAGDLQPTSGRVVINDTDCTRLPSRRRPGLGVARTYQRTRLMWGLTVVDNLYLAQLGRSGQGHRFPFRRRQDRELFDRAVDVAEAVALGHEAATPVGTLSHGQQRQLEIGMALAAEPELMMLDEPASGLSRGERERLIELLVGLPRETTLLLIEHDMDVALTVAERVTMMHDGVVIVEGTPAEIRGNQRVHDLYLGRAHV